MGRYVTTNIRFAADRYRMLKLAAVRESKSCAEIVREAVDARLGLAAPGSAAPTEPDPVLEWVGGVSGGQPDEAAQHDHYLYGWPKEGREKAVRGHRRLAGRGRSR